ncbi:hypothetical protein BpHYR1_018000 [Brachionus plicatilis]|uniref:Uncharacterized protein n=1 Tax=Brachionus plicatilis TaxID=10195 RepID=A0A3M7QQY6_BRAPC|nr:hypothetical protein BpHYR1_018000 [Brachionus plicatilis]
MVDFGVSLIVGLTHLISTGLHLTALTTSTGTHSITFTGFSHTTVLLGFLSALTTISMVVLGLGQAGLQHTGSQTGTQIWFECMIDLLIYYKICIRNVQK